LFWGEGVPKTWGVTDKEREDEKVLLT